MTKIHKYTVVLLLLFMSFLTFDLISQYLRPLLLAAIMAGLFGKTYYKINKKLSESASALITTFILIFTVLIPLIVVGVVISKQAVSMVNSSGPVINEVAQHPNEYVKDIYHHSFLSDVFETEVEFVKATHEWVKSAGSLIVSKAQKASANLAAWIVRLFIFLFAFYYFLIEGKNYLKWIMKNIPISQEDKDHILNNFLTVAEATLKGTLVIALIQGSIGGVTMYFLGVPNTMLWWILMVIASIIPAAGPALVWIPVAVFLYFTGSVKEAIILTVIGGAFIGLIDNFLRPKLVGQDVKMPELMILVTTLGGIAVYGLAGVIIGPIIGALFITTWDIFGKTFKDDIPREGSVESTPE